jgi:acyl carrier protein
MNENLNKLMKCFSMVFPEVPQVEIPKLSVNNTPEWDSLANIQLTSLIEEEFNIEIKSEELEELNSFDI